MSERERDMLIVIPVYWDMRDLDWRVMRTCDECTIPVWVSRPFVEKVDKGSLRVACEPCAKKILRASKGLVQEFKFLDEQLPDLSREMGRTITRDDVDEVIKAKALEIYK